MRGTVQDLGLVAHDDLAAVVTLVEAMDAHDPGSAEHAHRVGDLVHAIGRHLDVPPHRLERLRLAGILHDVGKVGVPEHVLRKPGPLNELEWGHMRRHPAIAARILRTPDFEDVRAWVLCHHERLDGEGYPAGLGGEQISIEARILAVADAYEAMTSHRVYSPALDREAALAEMRRGIGTQFDGMVVHALEEVVGREPTCAALGADGRRRTWRRRIPRRPAP